MPRLVSSLVLLLVSIPLVAAPADGATLLDPGTYRVLLNFDPTWPALTCTEGILGNSFPGDVTITRQPDGDSVVRLQARYDDPLGDSFLHATARFSPDWTGIVVDEHGGIQSIDVGHLESLTLSGKVLLEEAGEVGRSVPIHLRLGPGGTVLQCRLGAAAR